MSYLEGREGLHENVCIVALILRDDLTVSDCIFSFFFRACKGGKDLKCTCWRTNAMNADCAGGRPPPCKKKSISAGLMSSLVPSNVSHA